jgi:hypothetical protein
MTFAACVTDTVGAPVVAAMDGPWAALTVGPFGSLLGDGRSAIAKLGATSAADGGTDPTDAVGEALVAAVAGEDGGA